jgi:hypothetical protein
MRSALQNLRTFGIMDVYLRTGCIGEPGRVVGTATSTGHRPKLLAMLFMLLTVAWATAFYNNTCQSKINIC